MEVFKATYEKSGYDDYYDELRGGPLTTRHWEYTIYIKNGQIIEAISSYYEDQFTCYDYRSKSSSNNEIENESEREEFILDVLRKFWHCASSEKKKKLLETINKETLEKYFKKVYQPK